MLQSAFEPSRPQETAAERVAAWPSAVVVRAIGTAMSLGPSMIVTGTGRKKNKTSYQRFITQKEDEISLSLAAPVDSGKRTYVVRPSLPAPTMLRV
jgi:hypothetical protein